MNYIKENLEQIEANILRAAEKSGRKREDICLLAVTKTIGVEAIREAVSLGYNKLGENRVQELMSKYDEIDNASWHLIGHLQTNKVKYIIDKVELIHSLESLELAREISKRAKNAGVTARVLVEVNMAGEESKFGIKPDEASEFIERVSELENISVMGLMTVAPFVDNPEDNRQVFSDMKKLFVDIMQKNYDNVNMVYLSMGMTNDYEVAIEEGANIVRIGTGIFGQRNYF